MATPPRVTDAELAPCLGRIVRRRAKVDDAAREYLPDPDQADPRDVLDFLHQHPASVRWVREADIVDALTLNVWTWWQDRRREYRTLTAGVRERLFLTQLGAPLGINSRAGVRDRIHRLEALLAYDRPDEKITREARRVAALQTQQRDARTAFIAAHRAELHEITAGLVSAADRFAVDDNERDWLDELRFDSERDAFTPASLSVLNLASSEIRTAPAVLALDTTHTVHRVLRRADQLRQQFAELGRTPPEARPQ